MKVVLAGATGAIGTPLVRRLRAAGHDVVALTRNPARLRGQDVEPVVADVMDRSALLGALRGVRADAVMHQLTALSKIPIRHSGMAATNALRSTGSRHLVEAAALVGAHRFVTQSIVFGYGYGDHGSTPVTEEDPFGEPGSGPTAAHIRAMAEAERLASSNGLEGVALRYGLFYGPGPATASMVDMVRKGRFPVIAGGGGFANFVDLDDAAAATVAALEKGRAGAAYNIVDGTPVTWGDFADELARLLGARRPMRLPGWLLKAASPYAASAMTSSMRVSNARAAEELGWTPAVSSYREGLRRIAEAAAGH
jgi:nucleoside-diphosphate-sugar epimerase